MLSYHFQPRSCLLKRNHCSVIIVALCVRLSANLSESKCTTMALTWQLGYKGDRWGCNFSPAALWLACCFLQQNNIQQGFQRLHTVIQEGYSGGDLQIIACSSMEQASLVLATLQNQNQGHGITRFITLALGMAVGSQGLFTSVFNQLSFIQVIQLGSQYIFYCV